jgi:hypothetical protein
LGSKAPVGQACTHSPQATQLDGPIGSSRSKATVTPMPRRAMPMTSLCCTSRQARSHRPQAMQASSRTAIAGCDRSAAGRVGSGAKRDSATPSFAAQRAKPPVASRASAPGWSASSSSNTIRRVRFARSLALCTTMPGVGVRMQEATRTRSPSTSTMQARQLPSGR